MTGHPMWLDGIDCTGWEIMDGAIYRQFTDDDDCKHSIMIYRNNYFEIVNVDGEIAWNGPFPTLEKAWKAAMAIIEGMKK